MVLEAPERAGSLRKAARDAGVDVLVYEGGEGLRFDEFAIKAGTSTASPTSCSAGMLELPDGVDPRASRRGPGRAVAGERLEMGPRPRRRHFSHHQQIGNAVSSGEVIGFVANPYEDNQTQIRAPTRGIIIGRNTLPIVNMGDALFHIAWSSEHMPSKTSRGEDGRDQGGRDHREGAGDPIMDEDEII